MHVEWYQRRTAAGVATQLVVGTRAGTVRTLAGQSQLRFGRLKKTQCGGIAPESPPPMTITSLSLYRKPSHVAQLDTPPPRYLNSPSTSSQRESAPVAMTSDSAVKEELLVVI